MFGVSTALSHHKPLHRTQPKVGHEICARGHLIPDGQLFEHFSQKQLIRSRPDCGRLMVREGQLKADVTASDSLVSKSRWFPTKLAESAETQGICAHTYSD